MAIITAYGNGEKIYEGRVLNWWEHNGAWDSDWYAQVWDDETESVKTIEIGTTRFGGGTGFDVEIDATDDVIIKLYRKNKKAAKSYFETRNINQAKEIRKGDDVKIVKGRKIPVGTIGKCFWAGRVYNHYSRQNEDRIGIEYDGKKVFISAENAEAIGWEARLIHGKDRKDAIRRIAISYMPTAFQRVFRDGRYATKQYAERMKAASRAASA